MKDILNFKLLNENGQEIAEREEINQIILGGIDNPNNLIGTSKKQWLDFLKKCDYVVRFKSFDYDKEKPKQIFSAKQAVFIFQAPSNFLIDDIPMDMLNTKDGLIMFQINNKLTLPKIFCFYKTV